MKFGTIKLYMNSFTFNGDIKSTVETLTLQVTKHLRIKTVREKDVN